MGIRARIEVLAIHRLLISFKFGLIFFSWPLDTLTHYSYHLMVED